MTPTLRFAVCASTALHLAAVAALQDPVEAPHSPPVLLASLRASSLLATSVPELPASPAFRRPAVDTPVQKTGEISKVAPRAAADMAPHMIPAVEAGPKSSIGDASVPAPVPVAAPAPAAVTPLEPPRFDAAYLANPPPAYPSSARRRGIEGKVIVEARVGLGGEAREVRLVESAGNETLDQAAMEAVRAWRFVPARRGDQLVEASVRIPLVFRLN